MTGTCEATAKQTLHRLPPLAEEVACSSKHAGFAFDLSLMLLSFEHDSLVEAGHLAFQQLTPGLSCSRYIPRQLGLRQ